VVIKLNQKIGIFWFLENGKLNFKIGYFSNLTRIGQIFSKVIGDYSYFAGLFGIFGRILGLILPPI